MVDSSGIRKRNGNPRTHPRRPAFAVEDAVAGICGSAPLAQPCCPSEPSVLPERRFRHYAPIENQTNIPGELDADVVANPGDELRETRATRQEPLVFG